MNQNQPSSPGTYTPAPGYGGPPIVRPVFRPYVTYTLMGICVVVFLLQLATNGNPAFDVTQMLDKDNGLILQGQVWRFITPIFLHGSIPHIFLNMYALFFIGPTVERFYGRARYLFLFFLSGFAGNVMSFIFTATSSLGASTSIFGLLGAEGVLIYHNREIFGSIARRALSQVVLIAVLNLIIGLTPNSGIDNWGHIGGFIGGTLFAWFGGPLLQHQGSLPSYAVSDTRSVREVRLAGIAVGALFVFLAIIVTYARRG